MTLGARARLAWTPLVLWAAFVVWKAAEIAIQRPPATFGYWVGKLFIAAFLVPAGYAAWAFARRWEQRANREGPNVDLPMTWHRRSGSWLVLGMFGAMALIFGGLTLIAARI